MNSNVSIASNAQIKSYSKYLSGTLFSEEFESSKQKCLYFSEKKTSFLRKSSISSKIKNKLVSHFTKIQKQ